jgi:hypothetical protein
MDFFYDGQIRRYVTQFMRIFIGFKYKAGDGTLRHVPVLYGDMTRQVASIIRENSENKMPTVPRVSCYISNLELDTTRLSDPTFVSKLNISERDYDFDPDTGEPVYKNVRGGGYTVERLMPTPFKLTMKADIWTSNTDQKLQLMEQILVLFNPSLDIQTTDNYIDWTSLSVVNLNSLNFSSRTIPQGAESEIDISTMEFTMPIWISPPTKVKKLGIVRNVVMNIFSEQGDILGIDDLVYGGAPNAFTNTVPGPYGVLLLKSNNGQDTDYDLTLLNANMIYNEVPYEVTAPTGDRLEWETVLNSLGKFRSGITSIYFLQPNGTEIRGTAVINEIDPAKLLITIEDRPSNTVVISEVYPSGRTTVDAIIDPYKFNPKRPNKETTDQTIVPGTRYLMLDDVNNSSNVGQFIDGEEGNNRWSYTDSARTAYDGPDAWKNADGSDPIIRANSIIEWNGSEWIELITIWQVSTMKRPSVIYAEGQIVEYDGLYYRANANIFDIENTVIPPNNAKFDTVGLVFQNLKTGIQYTWNAGEWLKSFEGEYAPGYWRIDFDPA